MTNDPNSVDFVDIVPSSLEAKLRTLSLPEKYLSPARERLEGIHEIHRIRQGPSTPASVAGPVDHLTAARSVTADEAGARALARELARRPDLVTLERDLLRAVVLLARRAVRSEADLEAVDRAQLVYRTEGGPRP